MAMGVSTSLDTNGHGGGSNSLSRPATQGFALARQPCYRLRTMASTTDDLPPSEPVPGMIDTPFDSALSERYLVYALSTITARSLPDLRSEEHTSELQSLMRISYAVFCLKKKKHKQTTQQPQQTNIN